MVPHPSPQASLAALVAKREKLQEELRAVERQVFDLETSYLLESAHLGNVLKGFDGFLSSTKASANHKRSRKFQAEDRLFSLSSVTAPTGEEYFGGRGDGALGDGLQRGKSGGMQAAASVGKQKRGRTAGPREAKRMKQANELDPDDEDFGEVMPRQLA